MWSYFKEKYLIQMYSPFWSVLLLAVLSAYYFGITGTYWAVTGEFTRWGGEILGLLGIDASQWAYFKIIGLQGHFWQRIDGVMIIGMFLGILIATLLASQFCFTLPPSKIRLFQALGGGIIAGFGARLGMGCNLASFFTGIPQFSLHAWFFTFASILGIYCGTKLITLPLFQSKATLQKGAYQPKQAKKKRDTFFLGILVFLISLFVFILLLQSHQTLAMSLLFGSLFGFIISKAQICFTSAFRDLFLLGRGVMAKAIVLGMCLSSLGVFTYVTLGVAPKISWMGINVVLGGFLFGLGIVIAGGCECGWMYRALRGQMHFVIVGIGNVIGSISLAYLWSFFGDTLATNFPKINLLEHFGNYRGLAINYVLLIFLLILILWIEIKVSQRLQRSLNAY